MIENNLDKSSLPANLTIVGGSRADVDFDFHVTEAERIFRTICPTDEFMPRPPDPEDIIFDSDEKKDDAEKPEQNDQIAEPSQIEPKVESTEENKEEKMSVDESVHTN